MISKSFLLTSIFFIYGCTTDNVVAEEPNKLMKTQEVVYKVSNKKSLDEKIGSMLMVGFFGTSAPSNSQICRDIKKYNLGGVILFDANPVNKKKAKNIYSREQVQRLTGELQSCSRDGKLLIAVDQEGGRVQRLKRKYGFYGRFPKARDIRGLPTNEIYDIYNRMGEELSSVGINYNLAPVVDLAINRKNRVIYKLGRSFGKNPKEVVKYSKIFIDEMRANGVLTSLKHFPGHGSSLGDTHKGFVDVTKLWRRDELEPYRILKKQGYVDTIMVAHVFNAKLDPKYPATLSKKIVNGILRKQLGYNGVVITDDLQMGAITKRYSLRNTLKLAINAGDDLLLFGNQLSKNNIVTVKKLVDTIRGLVYSRAINICNIDRANRRIEALKNKI